MVDFVMAMSQAVIVQPIFGARMTIWRPLIIDTICFANSIYVQVSKALGMTNVLSCFWVQKNQPRRAGLVVHLF